LVVIKRPARSLNPGRKVEWKMKALNIGGKTMSKKIKRLGIYMPAELHTRLQYASIKLDKSMTQIAVEAIEEYLNKREEER